MYVLSQKLTGHLTEPQIFMCFYFRGYSLRVPDDDADELKVLVLYSQSILHISMRLYAPVYVR